VESGATRRCATMVVFGRKKKRKEEREAKVMRIGEIRICASYKGSTMNLGRQSVLSGLLKKGSTGEKGRGPESG